MMATDRKNTELAKPQAAFRARGAVMVESLLVLPLILVVIALVVYFGFAFERMQRGIMMDRYEAWRGASRAPGPAVEGTVGSSVRSMQELFFVGDDPTLRLEPSDFFPIEPSNELADAAAGFSAGAGALSDQYFEEFPRGRSMRFFVGSPTGSPLWERLFPGAIPHRHTVMDTDWRFMNFVIDGEEWYDDQAGVWREVRSRGVVPSTQTPSQAVREVFYRDYDQRLEPLSAGNNPLAERLQDFYQVYPQYWGPEISPVFVQGEPW